MINKKMRFEVYAKCNGRCAYCGNNLEFKNMTIDHVIPILRNVSVEESKASGIVKGSDNISNLNPSCFRCNKWKGKKSLEEFRKSILDSLTWIKGSSKVYGMLYDYRIIKEVAEPVVFYFEQIKKTANGK